MREELSEAEKILIEKIREDKMLRRAIFRYFEAMSGVKLPDEEGQCT